MAAREFSRGPPANSRGEKNRVSSCREEEKTKVRKRSRQRKAITPGTKAALRFLKKNINKEHMIRAIASHRRMTDS